MPVFTDQMSRSIELFSTPQRIISLVPSQTELLYALGLGERVAGITKYCVHPEEWFRGKTRVGGTKRCDLEKIRTLQPDLIIGNREENEQLQIESLMKEFNVWMSDISTLKDALSMIAMLGAMLERSTEATRLSMEIESSFARFASDRQIEGSKPLRAAYFIWRKPYMVAGHSTFINEMLKICGLENVFEGNTSSRYPKISSTELQEAAPELILLSSEPYPFSDKHVEEVRKISPHSKYLIVDGEIFSWYGSRLLHAPDYFRDLLAAI